MWAGLDVETVKVLVPGANEIKAALRALLSENVAE